MRLPEVVADLAVCTGLQAQAAPRRAWAASTGVVYEALRVRTSRTRPEQQPWLLQLLQLARQGWQKGLQ